MKTVILAGGSGTRLWPMSRIDKPKQFQNLIGNESMLIQTIKRLSFQSKEDVFVATNNKYIDIVKEQTKDLINPDNIIIEPISNDTSASIALIAEILFQKDPNSVMAVIYADHLIQDIQELEQKLKVAEQLALQENTLNIIEVKAVYPNVNLGYVKIGKQISEINNIPIYNFEKFIEKPDLITAKKFLKSQNYLWNTGLFVWKTSTILEKFKQFLPETYQNIKKIGESFNKENFSQILENLYPLCTKISIDYGIMEKINPQEVRIIPADLGWSDIGTWESIWNELSEQDQVNANVIKGPSINIDTKNSLIYADKKLITTIGLNNIIVVDTPDTLLICDKNQSHQIKNLIEQLKIDHSDLL